MDGRFWRDTFSLPDTTKRGQLILLEGNKNPVKYNYENHTRPSRSSSMEANNISVILTIKNPTILKIMKKKINKN